MCASLLGSNILFTLFILITLFILMLPNTKFIPKKHSSKAGSGFESLKTES
jgi:hypothetical protein